MNKPRELSKSSFRNVPALDIKINPVHPVEESIDKAFNSTALVSLATKYRWWENNLLFVEQEIQRHKTSFSPSGDQQQEIKEMIELKGDQLRDKVEGSLRKMDEKIRNSWSHQKGENSRWKQQIVQLRADEISVKNQWNAIKNRIEDIALQIGYEMGYGH